MSTDYVVASYVRSHNFTSCILQLVKLCSLTAIESVGLKSLKATVQQVVVNNNSCFVEATVVVLQLVVHSESTSSRSALLVADTHSFVKLCFRCVALCTVYRVYTSCSTAELAVLRCC